MGNGFQLHSPVFYAALFEKLGAASILDLDPCLGSKAVGSAILGIQYYTLHDQRFEDGLVAGLGAFVGLKHQWHAGEQVDFVISDLDLRPTRFHIAQVAVALQAAKFAKHVAVFVPSWYRLVVEQQYPPESVLPIMTGKSNREPDYFFIY